MASTYRTHRNTASSKNPSRGSKLDTELGRLVSCFMSLISRLPNFCSEVVVSSV